MPLPGLRLHLSCECLHLLECAVSHALDTEQPLLCRHGREDFDEAVEERMKQLEIEVLTTMAR